MLGETDLEQRPAETKLGKNDRIALDAFEEALEAKRAMSEGKSECRLHLDEWRLVFNRRHDKYTLYRAFECRQALS